MAVTLYDISQRAGVSLQTVGFALGKQAHLLKKETRDRIIVIAREMGYRKNMAARAMQKGRFDTVGFLFQGEVYVDTPSEIAAGMSDTLERRNIRMTLMRMTNELKKNPGLLNTIMCELMVDGLVLSCWGSLPPAFQKILNPGSAPIVLINTDLPFCAVRPDDMEAGAKATKHLIELGHRRIAYVDFMNSMDSGEHYSVKERAAGYKSAMLSAGLIPQMLIQNQESDRMLGAATQFLSRPDRPTAIVAYCHRTAYPFLYAAARMGIDIPGSLSIIMFEGYVDDLTGVEVTNLLNPFKEIGIAAAEMILARMDNPKLVPPSLAVPFKDIVGKTCVPPPKMERTKRKK